MNEERKSTLWDVAVKFAESRGYSSPQLAISAAPNRRAAPPAPVGGAEPTLIQYRMRPTWDPEGMGWTRWEDCSAASARDKERTPVLHDWQYEVRRLYFAPQAAPLNEGGSEPVACEQEAARKEIWLNITPTLGEVAGWSLTPVKGLDWYRYVAAPTALTVTDSMVYAFHGAIGDGAIGADEFEELRKGIQAALTASPAAPQPSAKALTAEQWLALAERHANADWNASNPDGYLQAIMAVCNDYNISKGGDSLGPIRKGEFLGTEGRGSDTNARWPMPYVDGPKHFDAMKSDPSNLHSPWLLRMPGTSVCVQFNHEADDTIDQARCKWIANACNAALLAAEQPSEDKRDSKEGA